MVFRFELQPLHILWNVSANWVKLTETCWHKLLYIDSAFQLNSYFMVVLFLFFTIILSWCSWILSIFFLQLIIVLGPTLCSYEIDAGLSFMHMMIMILLNNKFDYTFCTKIKIKNWLYAGRILKHYPCSWLRNDKYKKFVGIKIHEGYMLRYIILTIEECNQSLVSVLSNCWCD